MRKIGFLAGLAAAALLIACGGTSRKDDHTAGFLALEVDGDAEVEKLDLNGDGKADVYKYYNRVGAEDVPREKRERVLARVDLDLNKDGKIDVRQHHNRDGLMVREEMDLDFDERFDAIDFYREEKRVKRELYTDFGKTPTVWKYYEDDLVVRKEVDTKGKGKPDTFEYFEKGKLVRVGYDRDGDGKPDYYEESEAAAK